MNVQIKKANFYFLWYLILIFLFGTFFLYVKQGSGSDSTMSEWLINYQGGFTRRGLLGEISIYIATLLNLKLRIIIFLFQATAYLIYLYLIYNFFYNHIKNWFFVFAIFTPIFLLYPVAEVEVLGRKEIFLFIYFLFFLHLLEKKNINNLINLYVFLGFPIACAIYEQVILYAPFILILLLIKNKSNNFLSILKFSSLFLPSLALIFYFLNFPLSESGHNLMKHELMQNFDETCYMSCSMLVTNNIDVSNFKGMLTHVWAEPPIKYFEYIFRYILIFIIGFLPLHFLSLYSKFNHKLYFFFKFDKVISLLFLLYIPVLLLFIFGADWGRWINITYTFAVLFYFYLYKNNFISLDINKIKQKTSFFKKKRKLFMLVFIIYAFGWTPQNLFKGDVSSFPGYRIPYKTIKWINRGY